MKLDAYELGSIVILNEKSDMYGGYQIGKRGLTNFP